MMYTDEHVALCALNKIFGYYPGLAVDLMEQAGGAAVLFSGEYVRSDGPHPELFSQLLPSQLDWGREELLKIESRGFRFVGLFDEDYPQALRECDDPPLGLYLNGCSSPTEIFGLRPLIGFVGTRDISPYGRLWCQKLVRTLADAPITPCIVSGMALGADGIAHRTALECGLPTIGVMATGIDSIYPFQHESLAVDIVSRPGCGLVTDYPLGTSPVALNFLRRNRIIAGLVSAVVVVESKSKGGSLMTAKYAVGYSRDVFAVPGRLDDVRSAGCNSLIGCDMARIVTSAEELVGQLGLGAKVRGRGGSWAAGHDAALRGRVNRKYGEGSVRARIVIEVSGNLGITVEGLASALGLPFQEVLTAVGLLEADGVLVTDLLRRCSLTAEWG